MNRQMSCPPLKTWQFYSACIHHLGIGILNKIYSGVRSRQIHRWSADPATTESSQRNPIDRYEALLGKLMERGAVDVAQAAVARQVRIVHPHEAPEPTKSTIAEECLDDYEAILSYHQALQDPDASREEIDTAMELAIKELKENRTLRFRKEGWENGRITPR